MKTIFKISVIAITLTSVWMACEPLEKNDPVPNVNSSNLNAKFMFVNASPDAPALDFYVNNQKTESGIRGGGVSPYANVGITMNSVTSNTSLHVKADSGSIGGVLGSSDLIFRSTNTGVGNFSATSDGFYTVIVVDSIKRPKPLRTVNTSGFGDVTYYAPSKTVHGKSLLGADTVIQLSSDYNNSVVTYKFCLSRQVPASFFVPLGTPGTAVPLGATDPGGVRFMIITDYLPSTLASSPLWPVVTSGKFAARFINASPDAGTAACTVNGVTITGLTSYPFLVPASAAPFNPSIGSRSTTTASNGFVNPFTVGFVNNATTTGTYSVSVSGGGFTTINSSPVTFADKGVYTIILTGSILKKNLAITVLRNK